MTERVIKEILSWTSIISYLLGSWLFMKQNRIGFIWFIIGNLLATAMGVVIKTSGTIIAGLAFVIINIRGYVVWGRKKEVKNES